MSLFTDAQRVIPGGVNSPVRAFASVGGEPVFFKSAKGARFQAEDGREFLDYVGSWGPRRAYSKRKSPKKSARCCRQSIKSAWSARAQKQQ